MEWNGKWNGMERKFRYRIWKKILVWNGIWSGRFLVWNGNGMEQNCQYGIWKNRLQFQSIPCPGCSSFSLNKVFQISKLSLELPTHALRVPVVFTRPFSD